MTPAPTTAHMSNFDPIPRLQQIVATIEDGGHFDSPATAAHYINCAIKEIERLRQEYGEARREIGDSLQTLIHFRQERDTLRAERDEARRSCCEFAAMVDSADTVVMYVDSNRFHEIAMRYMKSRGWDCFKNAPVVKTLKGVVVSKGKAVPPTFDLEEDGK